MSAILDVEDPIADKYNLEVSSPGLESCHLFTLEQFQRYVGEDIAVHLRISVNRRKWQGKLEKIENDMLTLVVDGQEQILIFGNIQKANVIAKF